MHSVWITVVVMLGLLVASAAVAWSVWVELEGTEIGFHGMVAMALGSLATLIVGGGLMWLVYFSHKRGFDDEVGKRD